MAEQDSVQLLKDSDVSVGIVLPSGKSQAVAFLESLPKSTRARFKRYFERLRDGFAIKSPENMRHLATDKLGNELYELKNHSPAVRLYLVKPVVQTNPTRWVATHGVKKVKDNRVPAEILRAWNIYYSWAPSE